MPPEIRKELIDYLNGKDFAEFMAIPLPPVSADGDSDVSVGLLNIEGGKEGFFDSLDKKTHAEMISLIDVFGLLLAQVIQNTHADG